VIEALEERPGPGESESFAWPFEPGSWVPAADGWGAHKEVEISLALLLDARIPATLSWHPFVEKLGWFLGTDRPVLVLVPRERGTEARDLLAAPFEDEAFAGAAEEISALRAEPPLLDRVLRAALWAIVLYYLAELIAGTAYVVARVIVGVLRYVR
jgi:hypothetical protein